jgi:hypothetical protein
LEFRRTRYREWRSIEGNGRRDPLVVVALIKIEIIFAR